MEVEVWVLCRLQDLRFLQIEVSQLGVAVHEQE